MAECARRANKSSAYILHKVDEPLIIPPASPSYDAEKGTCSFKEGRSPHGKKVK